MRIKYWKVSSPAKPDCNGAVRHCLRFGVMCFGLALVTKNNVGCEWFVHYIRRTRITIYLWRIGVGIAYKP